MIIKINPQTPFNLYVLKLVKNKYYVGITCKNVHVRVSQHKNGKGAAWTKLYKPVNVIESFLVMLLARFCLLTVQVNKTLLCRAERVCR